MRARGPAASATAIAIGLLVLAAGPARSAQPYRIDPSRSELVIRVFKGGVAAGLAHDHVVRATELSGSIEFDPARPGSSSVRLTVPAGSLEVDEPRVRERFGLEGGPGEKDRGKIRATMLGPRQLDAETYPTISFGSVSVEATPEGCYLVSGEFTLHGETRPVRFCAAVDTDGTRLEARGSFTFLQSDFGIRPYRFLLGAVRNRDEVRLGFDLVARAGSEPPTE